MPRKMEIAPKVARLRAFHRKENRLPGYNEMMVILGYKSKNAVHGLLERLSQLGYIKKTGHKIAPTGKLTGTIRLLGTVQAGFPSPAEEELVDVLSLDEFLVSRPNATFMLTVSGDSMIDAGIHPGDIVLVEKGTAPANGDIVIAQVDGEWTMKYYVKERNVVRLEPANRKYSTITPKNSLVIGGVVRSLVRKYR
ncbi:MAG: transcriptional repressor LexA [bacterium]